MRKISESLARAILILVPLLMLPFPARARDPEFRSLVERMSAYYQKRPMRFMGWLNFFANRFTPHGVSHFQMVIFDDIDSSRTPPGEEFESALAGLVGPSYQPFVRVHEVRNGEWTCIFTRESGKASFEMVIVSIDSSDAVLMKMQLKPGAMREWVDEPVKRARDSGHRPSDSRGSPTASAADADRHRCRQGS
jgi:hypothetical protein